MAEALGDKIMVGLLLGIILPLVGVWVTVSAMSAAEQSGDALER